MCWIGNVKEPLKAEEDIKVFKIMKNINNKYISYYKGFVYLPNKIYNFPIKEIYNDRYEHVYLYEGFHSYSLENCTIEYISQTIFLAVCDKFTNCYIDCYPSLCSKIIQCIIPKGSIYYVNGRGEIISNQIKIIENVNC